MKGSQQGGIWNRPKIPRSPGDIATLTEFYECHFLSGAIYQARSFYTLSFHHPAFQKTIF